jgi:hypothetical protein
MPANLHDTILQQGREESPLHHPEDNSDLYEDPTPHSDLETISHSVVMGVEDESSASVIELEPMQTVSFWAESVCFFSTETLENSLIPYVDYGLGDVSHS